MASTDNTTQVTDTAICHLRQEAHSRVNERLSVCFLIYNVRASPVFPTFIRHYCDLAMVVTHSLKAKTLRFTGKSFRFHEFTIEHTNWLENKNRNFKKHLKCNIFFYMKTTIRYIKYGDGLIWVTKTNPHIIKVYTVSLKGVGCTSNGYGS